MLDNPDKHPSYGTVLFHRISGGKSNLFGSPIRNHYTTIKLTIHQAVRHHDLHEDRIHGHGVLAEVELSAAQFAELLTTMNVGSGVPCTIRFMHGMGKIEDPPDDDVEIDRVQESFKGDLTGMVSWLKRKRGELKKLLGKKSIGKGDRKEIMGIIENVLMEVQSNIPFTVDQFNEATERIVTAGKAEIDSFVTQMVQVTGLKQLQAMRGGEVLNTKALPSGAEGEDDGEHSP